MTKNVKHYVAAVNALTALETQLKAEFKADPRFKRASSRVSNILRLTKGAAEKYGILHDRKVPAKVEARKSGGKKTAAKKSAKKAVAKKSKKDNVVTLPVKAAQAASRAKSHVKRSK